MDAMLGIDGRIVAAGAVLVLLTIVAGVGWSMMGHSSSSIKRLHLTEAEHDALRAKHRFLVLGGMHGSGAALLARLLAVHPSVSGAPDWHAYRSFPGHKLTPHLMPRGHRTPGEALFFRTLLAFGGRVPADRTTNIWHHSRSAEQR